MKLKARKLLSLLLTLAMVVGMFVLPASAADTYTLDFNTIDTNTTTGTFGRFTLMGGTGVTGREKTYGTAGQDDYHEGTRAYRLGGKTSSPTTTRSIKFTTKYANATVKVWFENSSSGDRKVGLWENTGKNTVGVTKGANKSTAIDTISIVNPGTYYLGGVDGDLYIHKIILTDKLPAPSSSEMRLNFTVGEGLKVTDLTVGGASKDFDTALNVTKNAAVTFKVTPTETYYAVGEVKFGQDTLTADGNGVYTISDVGDTEATVTIAVTSSKVSATSVTLSAEQLTLKVGGNSADLTAKVEPDNSDDVAEVKSDNEKVATWANGKVSPVAIGKTTITATAGEYSDTCEVSVTGADQTASPYILDAGKMAEATYATGTVKYDNYFTINATDSKVESKSVTIDGTSFTKRLSPGAAGTITFTTSKAKSTVKVWFVQNVGGTNKNEPRDFKLDDTLASSLITMPGKDESAVVTFSNVAEGDHTIAMVDGTEYIFKIEVTEEEATPPEPTLKTMKDASPAVQRIVYNGQPITAKVKVVNEDGSEITTPVTYTYGTSAEGPFTSTVPSQKNGGQTTYWFHAEAEGYEPFTSTSGRTLTVNKANPKLTIVAKPDRVKQANDADRFTTLTVTCDLSFADVDKVTVTGADKDGNALPASKIVKVEGQKGVYTVHFNEPDTQIVYIFTASYDGKNADGSVNPNFNAATDTTANVTVINHTVPDRTYELTYDAKHIKITYPDSQGSTDKKVLYGAGVVAEAINIPEGQVFDCWVSADVTDPADKDWATKNPTKFAMPGKNVHLEVKFKAKTEETEADTKTLTALLRTAEGWRDYPAVATAAADVDKGEKWVTADEKEDFNKVIAAAQAVASSEKPTQAQVDEAEKKLEKAIEDFKGNFKDGTKSSGSGETTDTATLNCREIVTTADREPLTTEQVSAKGPFGVTGEVIKRKSTTPGENVARAFLVSKNGRGTITITVPANSTADIEAVVASSNSDNPTNFALKLGSETKENEEKITSAKNSPDTTVNWKALPTGTYSLTTTGSYDMFVRKITVITTTTSDGKPEVPQTEARKNLKAAIETAKKVVADAKVSTDGSEYSKDEKWVTAADKAALESAIELAEAKANSARFNDTALTEAKTALESAKALFEAAKKDGTKTSSSSGGGSSSNVPSSSGGTTVKNEDGSKTTTKTNKATGTVTETTTWPNGDKQVVVTEKDGTKTETVTKKDGTKTETVTKPDGSTTTAVTDAKGIKTETAVSASGETSAKVTLPKTVNKTVVTIPVKDATEGTVAVIVDAKGNETVIKTAVASENGLDLLVTGNVSVKIKDNAKKFDDIATDYWAKGAVDFVSSREIFKGTTDVTFAPTALVDRGMMATVLFRLADAKAEGENAFFDVPDGNWYTEAVTWANRSGVVTGYADGTFGPADAVTREQMATMLFRYAKVMGMDVSAKGDTSKFGDANDVSSWASEAMTWAVGVGLINGVADPVTGTTLSPAKTASRAEVATIMQRMVKLMMQ